MLLFRVFPCCCKRTIIFQDRKSRKERLRLEKRLKETMDKIEKRKPILNVLEAEGVKAAYNESQKRKREEEEESRKRQKVDKVKK